MSDHYVRVYDPNADDERWLGPLPIHMAGLVAEGLSQNGCDTRVFHRSELETINAAAQD